MARRTTDRKRSPKYCVKCGGAVAAGVLICMTCISEAAPAEARTAPAPRVCVVELVPSQQAPRFIPFASPVALPIGRAEDPHPPEPDYTFDSPGVFAGTAVTGQAAPQGWRPRPAV